MSPFPNLLAIFALIGAAVPAAAATRASERGEAALTKVLAGRVPGKPVNCISQLATRSSQIYDGTAIVYDAGRTLYVNRPPSGAESLRTGDILLSRTYSDQLCSLDTIRLLDQGSHFERGFVGLGQFVPYTKAPN